MQKLRIAVLVVLCSLAELKGFAWGMNGHRIVGQIADSYLTRRARAAIESILGTESLAMASNWADFVKSDTAYNHLYNWHFINFPEGLDKQQFDTRLAGDTSTNAYTKLGFLIAQLKQKDLPLVQKQEYLKLLIHIVGDLHQPLHTGRLEDLGGNKIKLTWFNEPTNLHRLWDEQLIAYQQLSYTEYAAAINDPTKRQRNYWEQQAIGDWLFESYGLANAIYSYVDKTDGKLSFRYNFDHVSQLNEQLLKGGVRLAGILNQLFG